MDPSTPVSNLKNLGPVSASWLNDIGISTLGDLQEKGVIKTFQVLQSKNPKVSLNMLWALHGAVTEMHWLGISDKTKKQLLDKINKNK